MGTKCSIHPVLSTCWFNRIIDIIERVQTRRNSDEKKAADRFTKAHDAQQTKRRSTRAKDSIGKKRQRTNASTVSSTGSVSSEDAPIMNLRRRQPSMVKATIDLSWKVGGTLYPKQTSRIGDEFQAVDIPVAGTYTEGAHADLYELIYDPSNQHATTVSQALGEVPVNKKEQAFIKLGLMATELANGTFCPDVASAVNELTVNDGSDWTSEEKETFHREIFRLRKDLTALSKFMGKDLNSCFTYYLSTFKKSDDYRILKVICAEERMDEVGENGNGVDACAVCGDGGSLIICDGCEGEYHMECLRPRLRTVPEGHWECDECVDRKLLEAQERLFSKTRLFEFSDAKIEGKVHRKSNGGDTSAGDNTFFSLEPNMRPSSPVLAAFKAFAAGLEAIFNAAISTRLDSNVGAPIKTEDIQPPVEHTTGRKVVFDAAALTVLDNDGAVAVKTEVTDFHAAVYTELDSDAEPPIKADDIQPPITHASGFQAVSDPDALTGLDNDGDVAVKTEDINHRFEHIAGPAPVVDAAGLAGLDNEGDFPAKIEGIQRPLEHTAGLKVSVDMAALAGLENDGAVAVKTEELQPAIEPAAGLEAVVNVTAMSGLENVADFPVKTELLNEI